jgi:hypothetical protein
MGRSLKKGPFVDDHLMKKVGSSWAKKTIRELLKLGHVVQQFSHSSSGIQLQFMMVVSTYRFTFLKTWLDISLVNLHQQVRIKAMLQTIRKHDVNREGRY